VTFLNSVGKFSHEVRKFSHGVRKFSHGLRKFSHEVRKFSHEVRKFSHEVRKFSQKARKSEYCEKDENFGPPQMKIARGAGNKPLIPTSLKSQPEKRSRAGPPERCSRASMAVGM
jgi:hypothetical protein